MNNSVTADNNPEFGHGDGQFSFLRELYDNNSGDEKDIGVYGDLFSENGDETACTIDNNANSKNLQPHTSPKRLKLDNDGFLTPANPKDSLQSCYITPSSVNEVSDSIENGDVAEVTENAEDTRLEESEKTEKLMFNTDQMENSTTVSLATSQVLREQGRSLKMLLSQWSDTFREREKFEENICEQLNSLLSAARDLEQQLMEQKEVRSQRLKDISQSLSSPT